jgi:hypothetical protein
VTTEACAHCDTDPARGHASIDGRQYCHEDPEPTCYMLTLWGVPPDPPAPGTEKAWLQGCYCPAPGCPIHGRS